MNDARIVTNDFSVLDCNVTVKGHQGAIEVPSPKNPMTNKCSWTIVAPPGNRVNITFTSFKMIKTLLSRFIIDHTLVSSGTTNQCNNSPLTVSTKMSL